jgi:hypothetical protein
VREQGLALVLRGDGGGEGVALVEHGLSVRGGGWGMRSRHVGTHNESVAGIPIE